MNQIQKGCEGVISVVPVVFFELERQTEDSEELSLRGTQYFIQQYFQVHDSTVAKSRNPDLSSSAERRRLIRTKLRYEETDELSRQSASVSLSI